MNYLLDTNACIALINGEPASVRNRFRAAIAAGHSNSRDAPAQSGRRMSID